MRWRGKCLLGLLLLFPFMALSTHADSVALPGSAGMFAILSDSMASSTGASIIGGNLDNFALLDTTTAFQGNTLARTSFTNGGIRIACRSTVPQGGTICGANGGVVPWWGGNSGTTIAHPSTIIPDANLATVPEPSTMLLLATGLIGGWLRKRQVTARA